MANPSLFSSATSKTPRADTVNEAGGIAYQLEPKHALAQIAATGCFNGTYYASASDQLSTLKQLIDVIDDNVYLAKLAIYARQRAYMKDMPAALLVALSTRDKQLTDQIFDRIVDNGRMLRNVFQITRSGQFGRKGLSSSLKRLMARWLNQASDIKLINGSIGTNPSLRDVLRMARPVPVDKERNTLFSWIVGKDVTEYHPPMDLLQILRYWQSDTAEEQADIIAECRVRWDLLADAAKGPVAWKAIARQMGHQALRMNLNTLMRHGVFDDAEMVDFVATRIGDPEEVGKARQFPYQYLAAYLNVDQNVPHKIRQTLQTAAEIACGNVPQLPGPVLIGVDVSGSMGSAATGHRGAGTSIMKCVDVAALFAAATLRRNPDSLIVPFAEREKHATIDPDDTILSISRQLAGLYGGGTNCAIPLHVANVSHPERKFVGCVMVSDNESWIGNGRYGATAVMTEWEAFRARQRSYGIKDPKLICIDIQPYTSTQAIEREDILNIGGFSDAVFNVVSSFLEDDSNRFVAEVEAIEL